MVKKYVIPEKMWKGQKFAGIRNSEYYAEGPQVGQPVEHGRQKGHHYPKTETKKSKTEKYIRRNYKASGGRVSLRGGGMCKKGMNKKARGANS